MAQVTLSIAEDFSIIRGGPLHGWFARAMPEMNAGASSGEP